MNYDKNEWRISIERLNSKLGYIKKNTVLCCSEFNGSSQWNQQKVKNILYLLKQEIIYEEYNFELIKKPRQIREKNKKIIIDNIDHYNCNHCHKIKPIDQFTKEIRRGCKKCLSIYDKHTRYNPRRALQNLLKNSKSHTKERGKIYTDKRDNTYNIDFEFLVELYQKQKGLCNYSGLPLKFGSCLEHDWTISLERIDSLKGYIKTNVCLICIEFNTCDKSVCYKNNNSGNSGWNKEKFTYFVEKATEKYKNEIEVTKALENLKINEENENIY